MRATVVVFEGDEEAKEVTRAVGVLEAVAREYNHDFIFDLPSLGGSEAVEACRKADAALAGSYPVKARPVHQLSQQLGLEAQVLSVATTRDSPGDADLLIVAQREQIPGDRLHPEGPTLETLRVACRLARQRWSLVTCVRQASERPFGLGVETGFPDVRIEDELLDLTKQALPSSRLRYDVMLGSRPCIEWVLSQSEIEGHRCRAAGSFGENDFALFHPVAGPTPFEPNHPGAIFAAAMLLRYGLGLGREASAVEGALASALTDPQFRNKTRNPLGETVSDILSGGLAYSQAI